MTGRDRIVISALAVLLLAITTAIGAPAFGPRPSPSVGPSGSPLSTATPYREGIVGRPTAVTPLTATTQADRDIVALVFSGLTRLGPDGTIVPDLAERWSANESGSSYIFTIRPDAIWQDGQPVSSDDVVYTIQTLHDPDYVGPSAASWAEVSVSAIDDRTVQFDLQTPVAGFLTATTQPLLPAHLLRGIPVSALADIPFSRLPVGSGPFRLVAWDDLEADLEPAFPGAGIAPASSPGASSSAAPKRVQPYLGKVELHFYADPSQLADDYRAGELDAAVGLPAALAKDLVGAPGSRLVRYPRSTFTGIVLNLRISHRELRDVRVRRALLAAVDRSRLIDNVLAGNGVRADMLIPPSSWAFEPDVASPVRFDLKAATSGLRAAGWKLVKGRWVAPGGSSPYRLQLLAPEATSNPVVWATAQGVASDWKRFGLTVDLEGLPPAEFVGARLQTGLFGAAAVDVNVGLDPDLYPLLASTQTASRSNVSGLQVPALDKLLEAARRPGSVEARMQAFKALETDLAANTYVLPLFFRDEVVVLSQRVQGPAPRQLADPADRYWDVLTWRLASGR
jgi:peptide/nickel transport system substrate-binding protein